MEFWWLEEAHERSHLQEIVSCNIDQDHFLQIQHHFLSWPFSGCVFVELVKREALWPGKSDVDQLYLIRKNLGDLIPRHMQIFKANEFFCGLSIPDPGTIEPLEHKLPKDIGTDGADFTLRCLDKDPARRWSCEQLLTHSFFKSFSFKLPESEEDISRRNGNYNNGGMLLPHLPQNGGFQNGSPQIR